MCPTCLGNLTVVLGGAGSAVLLAAAGLRFQTARAPEPAQSKTEEIPS